MKKNNIVLLFPLFLSIMVILFYGCTASSGTIRYSKSKEIPKEDSSVRFSSAAEQEETFAGNDSLDIIDLPEEDDIDDMPDEDAGIDISSVISKINNSENSSNISADQSSLQEKLLMEIIKYLNTPYRYGGNSKDGIDCSAFTQTIYRNTLSIPLLRSARDQYTMGIEVPSREDLEFGDLVFFNTRRRVRPGHVGIYIGDNLFAHASTKHGVIVSSLDHEYYSKRFMGGRRVDVKMNAHL